MKNLIMFNWLSLQSLFFFDYLQDVYILVKVSLLVQFVLYTNIQQTA